MTKELTILLTLIASLIFSGVGGLVFERNSLLSEVDFSQKTVPFLDPTLKLNVLQ